MLFFFFQAEDGIRDVAVTGVQTCALPISRGKGRVRSANGWKGARSARCAKSNSGRTARSGRKPSIGRSRSTDRKSTRLNSSHGYISYAVFCLKKKKKKIEHNRMIMHKTTV